MSLEHLIPLHALVRNMSAPKLGPLVPALVDSGCVPCANPSCKAMIPESEVRTYVTGIVTARDTLCRDCERLVPTHALVVCVGCRVVVARMAPETLDSGFRIKPLTIYHTEACPNCKPGVQVSKIIEAELFYKNK